MTHAHRWYHQTTQQIQAWVAQKEGSQVAKTIQTAVGTMCSTIPTACTSQIVLFEKWQTAHRDHSHSITCDHNTRATLWLRHCAEKADTACLVLEPASRRLRLLYQAKSGHGSIHQDLCPEEQSRLVGYCTLWPRPRRKGQTLCQGDRRVAVRASQLPPLLTDAHIVS